MNSIDDKEATMNEENMLLKNDEFDKESKQSKATIECNMFPSKYYVPFKLITPARKKMKVREVNSSLVDGLEYSYRKLPGGIHLRSSWKINLYPKKCISPEEKEQQDNLIKDINSKILAKYGGKHDSKLIIDYKVEAQVKKYFNQLLFSEEFRKTFKLEIIGGNHSREAVSRIIDDPGDINIKTFGFTIKNESNDDTLYNCFECQIYFNLSKDDAHSIAVLDNTVHSMATDMSETDIAKFIFSKWQDKNSIENLDAPEEDRIFKSTVRLGIYHAFMYDPKKTVSDKEALINAGRKAKLYHTTKEIFQLLLQALELPGKAAIFPDNISPYLTIYDPDNYFTAYNNYIDTIDSLMKKYNVDNDTVQKTIGRITKKNRDEITKRKEYQKKAKEIKDEFFKQLEVIKFNAKIACTIINILKTNSEFKSKSPDIIFPWESWTQRKDLISYCKSNNIDISSIYTDSTVAGVLKRACTFKVIQLDNQVEQIIIKQLKQCFRNQLNVANKETIVDKQTISNKVNAPIRTVETCQLDIERFNIEIKNTTSKSMSVGKKRRKKSGGLKPKKKMSKTKSNQITDDTSMDLDSTDEEEEKSGDLQERVEEENQVNNNIEQIEAAVSVQTQFNHKLSNHEFYFFDFLNDPTLPFLSEEVKSTITLIVIEPPINFTNGYSFWGYRKIDNLLKQLLLSIPTATIVLYHALPMLSQLNSDFLGKYLQATFCWYTMIDNPVNIHLISILKHNIGQEVKYSNCCLPIPMSETESYTNKPISVLQAIISKLPEKLKEGGIILNLGCSNSSCAISAAKNAFPSITIEPNDKTYIQTAVQRLNDIREENLAADAPVEGNN